MLKVHHAVTTFTKATSKNIYLSIQQNVVLLGNARLTKLILLLNVIFKISNQETSSFTFMSSQVAVL